MHSDAIKSGPAGRGGSMSDATPTQADGHVLEARGLNKRFGRKVAVLV